MDIYIYIYVDINYYKFKRIKKRKYGKYIITFDILYCLLKRVSHFKHVLSMSIIWLENAVLGSLE